MSKYYRSCTTAELPKKSGNSTVHYCFVFLKSFLKKIKKQRRKALLIEFFLKNLSCLSESDSDRMKALLCFLRIVFLFKYFIGIGVDEGGAFSEIRFNIGSQMVCPNGVSFLPVISIQGKGVTPFPLFEIAECVMSMCIKGFDFPESTVCIKNACTEYYGS